MILAQFFYQRNTLQVAEDLIGKIIVRKQGDHLLKGIIVETEAYIGKEDSACHAAKGKTKRTEIMFGEAGYAYVYFVYGMHYMFNIVTEKPAFPAAVLIRAIEPVAGIEKMISNRNVSGKNLTNGPAKLCQALGINKSLNGINLTTGKKLWIEDQPQSADFFKQYFSSPEIGRGSRIGIDYAEPKDRDAKWRFFIKKSTS